MIPVDGTRWCFCISVIIDEYIEIDPYRETRDLYQSCYFDTFIECFNAYTIFNVHEHWAEVLCVEHEFFIKESFGYIAQIYVINQGEITYMR